MKFAKNKLQLIVVIVLYLILVLTVTFPTISKINEGIIGNGGDNREYYSYFFLVHSNLAEGKLPFAHSNTFRYPQGFNFFLGSDAKIFILVGGLILFVSESVVFFNLLILIVLLLNCLSAYFFFTRIIKDRSLAFCGGFAYGVSYFVLTRGAGHINLIQLFTIPLISHLILSLFFNKLSVRSFLFKNCLLFLLTTFLSIQYALILIGFYLYSFLFLLLFNRLLLKEIVVNNLKLLLLVTSSTFVFFFIAFQDYFLIMKHENPFIGKVFTQTSTPIIYYFFQNEFYLSLVGRLVNSLLKIKLTENIDYSVFVGHIEFVLFLPWFFIKKRKKEMFLFLTTIFFWFCSLGSFGVNGFVSPYYLLKLVPPFKFIQEPERFFIIFYLFFIALNLVMVEKITMNFNRKKKFIFVAVIFLAIFFERFNNNFFFTPGEMISGADYTDIVSTLPGEAVLDVPVVRDFSSNFFGTEYNHLPYFYKKKIVDGYFHWIGENSATLDVLQDSRLKMFRCSTENNLSETITQNHLEFLYSMNIKVIVIHKSLLRTPGCEALATNIDQLTNPRSDSIESNFSMRKVFEDQEAVVFSISENQLINSSQLLN